MPLHRALLQLLRLMRAPLSGNVSLHALATRSGWSPFHLQRTFRRVVGETPKQYTLRLRLERAAVRLTASDETVLGVSVATGFASHEVFARAFRRRFGRTPSRYRAEVLAGASVAVRSRHHELIAATGPCIGLYHFPPYYSSRTIPMPTDSITRQELAPQPVLFVRLRAARHELAAAIGEGVGKAYVHSQKAGFALAGHPYTRYLTSGPGLMSIEVGVPLVAPGTGEAEVEAGFLPGGPVAVAIHKGAYEQLQETYVALERWIEEKGLRAAGPPWEAYLTDPADHPDPAEWRTAVHWPLEQTH